jgi:hypothetical protein
MKLINSNIKSFPGKHLKIRIDDLNLEFANAKDKKEDGDCAKMMRFTG